MLRVRVGVAGPLQTHYDELRKPDNSKYKGTLEKAINGALSSTGVFSKMPDNRWIMREEKITECVTRDPLADSRCVLAQLAQFAQFAHLLYLAHLLTTCLAYLRSWLACLASHLPVNWLRTFPPSLASSLASALAPFLPPFLPPSLPPSRLCLPR